MPISVRFPAKRFAYARLATGPGDYDCSDDPGAFAHFPDAGQPTGRQPFCGEASLVTAFLSGVAWTVARTPEDA